MNKEDERIRKVFQELKEEDARNAPAFTRDWNAALSRMDKPRRRWTAWQMSTGFAAMLILLGASWWMFVRQSTMQPTTVEIVTADTSTANTLPPVISPPTPEIAPPGFTLSVPMTAPPVLRAQSRTRHSPNIAPLQRPVRQPQPPAVLISRWSSPTESLLRIPGEPLLKIVPSLDDSVVKIKTSFNQKKLK